MITWMQRHRKYLVITIWISTIAFLGAGSVGWGDYKYGDKAGAVAKVGDITITQEELQKSYSALFNQYNQMFQGKLDEKQAKEMGLQHQALKNLVDQALILNLAAKYSLTISDKELFTMIKNQTSFVRNGHFDKQHYTEILKQNHLTPQQYETSVRRELLIQKVLYLFSPNSSPLEEQVLASALGVADKVEYKLLTPDMVSISVNDTALKTYWEKNKNAYKKVASYDVSVAHPHIDPTLDDSAASKEALHRYIDFKKGTLPSSVSVEKINLPANSTLFPPEILKEIAALNAQKPFLKPRKVDGQYVIIKLEKLNPPMAQSYEEAFQEVTRDYTHELKKNGLQTMAQNTFATFHGIESDFITQKENKPLAGLTPQESTEFLTKLFSAKQKRGFLALQDGNVLLYNISNQKLLYNTAITDSSSILKLKQDLLDQKLLKKLTATYPIEIYAEGI